MQIKWLWKCNLKSYFNLSTKKKLKEIERLHMKSLKLLNFHQYLIKTSVLAVVLMYWYIARNYLNPVLS